MTHVAIDTCVFEHYLNLTADWNADHHIDLLLSAIVRAGTSLCVDSRNRISGEYETKITPIIASRDEKGIERFILTYFMLHCQRITAPMDEADRLMVRIKREIHEEPEAVDRAFVYVACVQDCKLITNDRGHILSRRAALRKATKEYRGGNTDFISSQDAAQAVKGAVAG